MKMIEGYINEVLDTIQRFIPPQYLPLLAAFFAAILIALYSILTWKFYKFIARQDILSLNLSRYNQSEHPILSKLFAMILYLIEYIIILPLVIFVWFSVFTIMLLILSENLDINQILLITAAIVGAIRILAYYEESLAEEIAKQTPLTLLIILISQSGFSSANKVVSNIIQIPSLISQISSFFILIMLLELVLRILNLIATSGNSKDED